MPKSKVIVPNVVRGGIAIPLKDMTNYYYMLGRSHKDGGIDIGKDVEVQGGELVQTTKDAIKVFSDEPFSDPPFNGKSSSRRVLGGENPNKVFNQQEEFKKRHGLNDDGTQKRMGGLSRSKDYGSKSKPYPSVKSKDFAGGNRSYPIPTKEDAVDALRLAGLHGRSDVKAKVYSKYPELRKKAKTGGLYSITIDGKTSLRRFPSTGERTKAATGAKINTDDENINNNVISIPYEDIDEAIARRENWLIDKHKKIPFSELRKSVLNTQPRGPVKEPLGILPPTPSISLTNPLKDNLSKEKGLYFDRPNWLRRARVNTGNYLKNNPGEVNDLIGLTSNITGGLLSHRINRNMLNKLQYVAPPTPKSAVKLKTHININPQLDRMRESLANYERTINNNTTSSNVALARRNQARLANTMQTNELYGNRENAETQLINQDRTNQQNVANENIADYNKWLEGLNAFRNSIIDKKSENNISLVENINSGIQDLINRREKRRSDNQTIAAMTLANPDLPVEMLYVQGLINKSLYDRYMKAYRNRNNKTTTQQG